MYLSIVAQSLCIDQPQMALLYIVVSRVALLIQCVLAVVSSSCTAVVSSSCINYCVYYMQPQQGKSWRLKELRGTETTHGDRIVKLVS